MHASVQTLNQPLIRLSNARPNARTPQMLLLLPHWSMNPLFSARAHVLWKLHLKCQCLSKNSSQTAEFNDSCKSWDQMKGC